MTRYQRSLTITYALTYILAISVVIYDLMVR